MWPAHVTRLGTPLAENVLVWMKERAEGRASREFHRHLYQRLQILPPSALPAKR
jgi:hypothetical protein